MKIPVFYSQDLAGPNPNQAKCIPVVKRLIKEFGPDNFVAIPGPRRAGQLIPAAALVKSLYSVHSKGYVDGVLKCDLQDGYGASDGSNLDSIMTALWCWITAVKEVCNGDAFCAMAPVGGFHHACYASGGGFCTFNGLMLGERIANSHRVGRQAGILDMDEHYGNGTADIIKTLRLNTPHSTLGSWKDKHGVPLFGKAVLEKIRPEISRLLNEGTEILFYQAGADPHLDDPLGGRMSTEELRARDRIVFEACRDARLPVVWCLAGGYQGVETVVDLHATTYREAMEVFSEFDWGNP